MMNNYIKNNPYAGDDRKIGYVRVALVGLERFGILEGFVEMFGILDKFYDKPNDEMIYLCESESFSPVSHDDTIPFYTAKITRQFDFERVTEIDRS